MSFILTVLFTVLGCLNFSANGLAEQYSKARAAGMLEPGIRVGKTYIGETYAALFKSLGPSTSADTAMGRSWDTWTSNKMPADKTISHLDVYTQRDPTGLHTFVTQIQVDSPFFKTQSGLAVGSTLAEITRVYPRGAVVKTYESKALGGKILVYDDAKDGIAFECRMSSDQNALTSKCIAIRIHRAGTPVLPIYLLPRDYDQ